MSRTEEFMEIANLFSNVKKEDVRPNEDYILLYSRTFNDNFVLVINPDKTTWNTLLLEVREKHPDVIVFFPVEIKELERMAIEMGSREKLDKFIISIYHAKKETGAWIVPKKQ